MKRAHLLALSVLCVCIQANAHDIITTKLTYTRDISRMFARRCLSCHATDSSVPLTTYTEVRPWAVDIKQQVLRREMPPWGAVKGFGNIAPDLALSQEEVMIIAAWVIGGAPEGNPALLPKSPLSATAAAPEQAPLDAFMVSTRSILKRSVILEAIRPIAKTPVVSARIVATLPSGEVKPLLWLLAYDPKSPRSFRFRQPLLLPSGTVVEANAPVDFALECSQSSFRAPQRGR